MVADAAVGPGGSGGEEEEVLVLGQVEGGVAHGGGGLGDGEVVGELEGGGDGGGAEHRPWLEAVIALEKQKVCQMSVKESSSL